MHLSEIIILGGFLTLSIGEPIPIPRLNLIKPRCDNHTEPPYPYSLGSSAGVLAGASSGIPVGPAGTGNPTLGSNSAGGPIIGSSESLPSSSVRGPTAASGSIPALQTGVSGGTGTGPPSLGASSATGSAPFENSTSPGLTGTGISPNPTSSGGSGSPNGLPSGTGIGPLITGASSSIGPVGSGNSIPSGFTGTGVGPISGTGNGLPSTGAGGATGSVIFGNSTSVGVIGLGTGSISIGIEVVPTGISTASEFPPFPTLNPGTATGGTGQTLFGSPTNSSYVPTSTLTGTIIATTDITPTSQANVTSGGIGNSIPPYPYSSSSTSVTLVVGASSAGIGGLPSLTPSGTGGLLVSTSPSLSIVSVPPISATGGSQGTGNTAAVVTPLTLNLTIVPVPSTTTSGVLLGTGNTLISATPPLLSLTSTSASYTSTSGGVIQGTDSSVLVVPSPTLSITTVYLSATPSITVLTPPLNISLTLLSSSLGNPPILGTGNTAIILPSPSSSPTTPGLPSTATSGGLTQDTGVGTGVSTATTPVPFPKASGVVTDTLVLNPSILASIPINATAGLTIIPGASSDTGVQSASGSSPGATGSSVTPTTFDTITKPGGTSTSDTEPTVPVQQRKPYKGSWRNSAPSDPPSYGGYGYNFANHYGYNYD